MAFLKIDAKTLAEARKEGKTLAAVAADQGISETQLKAFLVKQMNDRLDAGVEKGRLTQEQAEKMKQNAEERVSAMINGKGPMHGPGHKGGPAPFDKDALLSLLKMDNDALRSQMKAGKTLKDIAGEQGVSEQALKDFFLTQMNARIDAGLKDGRLSAERAEKMKQNAEERVADMINGKGPMHGPGHKRGTAPFDKDALLSLLKIDDQTLRSELKAGKTFAAIAGEQGVSEQELKDFFLTQMNARIDAGLKDGRISAERAEQMKKHAEERVTDLINGKGPMQKADYRDGKRKEK